MWIRSMNMAPKEYWIRTGHNLFKDWQKASLGLAKIMNCPDQRRRGWGTVVSFLIRLNLADVGSRAGTAGGDCGEPAHLVLADTDTVGGRPHMAPQKKHTCHPPISARRPGQVG